MEFEKERDRVFLEFKKEEAEKNRRHELEIAKIFPSLTNNPQQQRDFRYTPFDQTYVARALVKLNLINLQCELG